MDKKLYQRVVDTQKDFNYTCLVNNSEIEAWRCKKEGTNVYAFDIVITGFGIAVFGDISTVTFRVGASYGINFLAGDDVDYYILSKVEGSCKNYDFDKEEFLKVCKESTLDFIVSHKDLFKNYDEDLFENDEDTDKLSFTEIKQFVINEYEGSIDHALRDLVCFLDEVEDIEFIEDAYHIVRSYNIIHTDYFIDHAFTNISESTTFLVYMINHAAKQIKKIKEFTIV